MRTDDAWQVRGIDPVGIDQDKLTDAQPGEILRYQRSDATQTHDGDARLGKQRLSSVSEDPRLPIEAWVRHRDGQWLGSEGELRSTYDSKVFENVPPTIASPDVPGYRLAGEHEGTDGDSIVDVEQRWIAPLVRRQIGARKAN